MQYASWLLLFALLVGSILGLIGLPFAAVVIGSAIALVSGLAFGFLLSEIGNWRERNSDASDD